MATLIWKHSRTHKKDRQFGFVDVSAKRAAELIAIGAAQPANLGALRLKPINRSAIVSAQPADQSVAEVVEAPAEVAPQEAATNEALATEPAVLEEAPQQADSIAPDSAL